MARKVSAALQKNNPKWVKSLGKAYAQEVLRMELFLGEQLAPHWVQKRRGIKYAVRMVAEAHPDWGNREIGEALGLSHPTVARYK